MRPSRPLTIESFDHEVDSYSIVNGEYTEDFDVAGGTIVLKGRYDDQNVEAAVSAASLPQALGHAVLVLLGEADSATSSHLRITGYVDSETGHFTEVDRDVAP